MPTAYGVGPVLHINDPLSYFTQPVPLRTLLPIWIDAIVVHRPQPPRMREPSIDMVG